jgi:hypothetical protein
MSEGMYEVLALIPTTSDFSLEKAVAYYSGLTFSKYRGRKLIYKNEPVRAELAKPKRARKFSGFRVFYGDWAIVAWLEDEPHVRSESQDMAEWGDLPAPAEVIAGCTRRLSVWSDKDLDFEWTDELNEYLDHLRGRFGVFIMDPVNGGWWT